MSGTASGPSQSRASRVGSYYFCIEGLPRGFTWQDLKDLIRREASHGIWTEMYRHPDGTTGETGYVRVQRLEEANNLYNYLVSRRLQVHFFDTSKAVPQKLSCTCSRGQCVTQRSHSATINNIAASPTSWLPLGSLASYPQPAVTYAVQPTMQYTTAPVGPPMTAYAPYQAMQQSLEDSMSGLRVAEGPSYSPFQRLCGALNSTNPELRAKAAAKVTELLIQCSSPQDQQALAANIRSCATAMAQAQTPDAPPMIVGADGTPVNSSGGVIITEASSVFVSKLDFKATVKDIEQRFSQGGLCPVKCTLQKDQATGKSRGHAIVQYANAKDAKKAVTMFDKQKFMGMEISVRLDKEKVAVNPPQSSYASSSTGRSSRSGGSSGSGSSRAAAAAESRMNAGPIIANGSSIKG